MKWVTVWGNATSVAEHRPETYAKDITLRYPVTCAFGGSRLRLHFSNFCGTEAVVIGPVTVAVADGDRGVDEGSLRTVTFGGGECAAIAAGEEIFSDEIDFAVSARQTISVSFYLRDFTLMRSAVIITGPLSKGFFSLGDRTRSAQLPLDYTRSTQTFYFLTGVDLYTDDGNRCVITYGDSITSQSYPDYLALKFMGDGADNTAVVRRAASGTRVLREYKCITYESYGLSGEHRFGREIGSVSGADCVLIQQGINDIIHPVGTDVNPFRPMSDLPTMAELEAGVVKYLEIAARAGLKVYIGTLLPIKGWRTFAPFREEMRLAFNDWARSFKGFDGVVDFDKALRDKNDPAAFAVGNDSGDHLHPSERAYSIMSEAAYEVTRRK